MDLVEKYLGEGVSKYRNEFIKYAKEIIKNIVDKHNFSPIDYKQGARNIQNSVIRIMGFMALDKSNPNYKNMKKYMPKKYNEILFTNGDKNTYDSEWMSMTDDKQFTVVRKAMLQFSKEKMDNMLNKNDMI